MERGRLSAAGKDLMERKKMYIQRGAAVLLTALLLTPSALAAGGQPAMARSIAAAAEAIPAAKLTACAEADWRLLLVGPRHELPEGYTVDLVALKNGLLVDERIYDDLNAMLTDCRAAGLEPIVCSAYRTEETQTRLYRNKISRLLAAGYGRETAQTEAARWVAPPGTSEHQTGMALDIVSASYQLLDSAQAETEEQQWLMEHCWEYGFILRYPEDKVDITGIGYEPWHYRYVGREAALAMRESGECLEEYLGDVPPAAGSGETA